MSSNNLTDDIKHTGWALRDWLGPYYTLGCAVAFGIALLTLLDPSGQLVRAVGAVLLVLTILAWVYHFYRQHQAKVQGGAASGPKVKLHGILLAVTLFFLCGIVISDAVMRGKRPGAALTAQPYEEVLEPSTEAAAPEAATAQPAPTAHVAPSAAQPAAKEVAAPAPAAPAPVAVAPAAVHAPASPIVTVAPAPAHSEPRVLPARIDVLPDSPNSMARPVPVSTKNEPARADARTSHAERNSERSAEPAAAPRAAPPVNRQRCSSLLGKFSLGEELNAEDKRFLETSCR